MSPARELPLGFSQVYRRYFGFVWRLCYRLGVDARDLEDVAQEVFIVVHRQLPGFEQRSRFETWLAAITRRVAWRHRRGRERARRKHDALGAVDRPDDGFSFERSAAIRSLDRFLQDLPHEQREVFVLSELQGLGGPEIVDVTGMNLNTVYARLRTTRRRFDSWCSERRVGGEGRSAVLLERSRRELRPPPEADRRVWAMLAIRLAAPPVAAGTTGIAKSIGVFAVTLAIGAVGLVVATTVLPPRPGPAKPPEADASRPAVHVAKASAPRTEADEPPAAHVQPPTAEETPSSSPRPAGSTPLPRSKPPAPPPASAPPSEEALARERSLIASSRDAVERDPARALELLDAHEREFPRGALARERARLRVRALCRADRVDEARTAARAAGDPSLLARECSIPDGG